MLPLNEQQRLNLIDSSQLYEAYEQARHQSLAHKYGMNWKTARGREYLFRASDATGHGRSLGVRSAETEVFMKPLMPEKFGLTNATKPSNYAFKNKHA